MTDQEVIDVLDKANTLLNECIGRVTLLRDHALTTKLVDVGAGISDAINELMDRP